MPRPRGGVATGHIAHRIVGGVLVGDAAHAGHGVNLVSVSIGVAACRAAGDAVQAVVAVCLGIGRQRRASWRWATVIPAGGRAGVAGPGQPIERVVAERLVLRGRAAALRGDDGGEAQHVAHIIVGARLTPERLPGLDHTVAERTLDAVVLGRGAKNWGGNAALGAGAAHRQSRDLPIVGVTDLTDQERHRIGRAGRAKVDGLQTPVGIISGGQGFPVRIDQAAQLTAVVVGHLHRLRDGAGIGRRHRERTLIRLAALVIAVTAPAAACSARSDEDFRRLARNRVGGVAARGCGTTRREGRPWRAGIAIAIIEIHLIGAAATGVRVCRCERAAQWAIYRVVAGVAALVARIGLAHLVAVRVIGILPGGVRGIATVGRHGRIST